MEIQLFQGGIQEAGLDVTIDVGQFLVWLYLFGTQVERGLHGCAVDAQIPIDAIGAIEKALLGFLGGRGKVGRSILPSAARFARDQAWPEFHPVTAN